MGRSWLQEDYDSGTYARCRLYGRVARGLCLSGGAGGQHAHGCEHGAVLAGVRCAAGFVAGVVVVTTLLSLATLALLLTLLRV